jgi:hypothetical protein
MRNTNENHTATCEDGPEECATCARIVAERLADARIRERRYENEPAPGRCYHAGGLACRNCA